MPISTTRRRASPAATKRGRWRETFIKCLSETGNVSDACAAAGVGRTTAYAHQKGDAAFAERWELALEQGADVLEREARRRAAEGVCEPVFHQGQPGTMWVDEQGKQCTADTPGAKAVPAHVRKYSDTLLIFLLKGAKPQKYRENVNVSGSLNIVVPSVVVEGVPASVAKRMELPDAPSRN
jgi:hypothetical protein